MKIDKLINLLQQIDKNADIYIQEDFEIYEPIVQSLYDNELNENYFILTSNKH